MEALLDQIPPHRRGDVVEVLHLLEKAAHISDEATSSPEPMTTRN
jgi:hypothetical protein